MARKEVKFQIPFLLHPFYSIMLLLYIYYKAQVMFLTFPVGFFLFINAFEQNCVGLLNKNRWEILQIPMAPLCQNAMDDVCFWQFHTQHPLLKFVAGNPDTIIWLWSFFYDCSQTANKSTEISITHLSNCRAAALCICQYAEMILV